MIGWLAKGGVLLSLVVAVQAGACDKKSPTPGPPQNPTPPPQAPRVPVPSPDPIVINGSERLGWDQLVYGDSDIGRHEFFIYIDEQRTRLDATCESVGLYYQCSSPLPPMEPGRHRLQLQAAHTMNGVRIESRRSGFLIVTKTPTGAPVGAAAGANETADRAAAVGAVPDADVDAIAEVGAVADLAIAPDGQVFVAERRGRVLAARNGRVDSRPLIDITDAVESDGLGMFSIALHPDFAKNKFVYLIYAAATADGPVFRIARGREVGGTIGEVSTLLQPGPVGPGGWAVLRFSPGGQLFVALRPGAVAAAAARNADESHILRLNDDGRTPSDNPRASPVVSSGHTALSGLTIAPIGLLLARAPKDGRTEVVLYSTEAQLAGRDAPVVLPLEGYPGGIAYESRSERGLPNRVILARLDGGVDLLMTRARGEAQGRRERVAEQYGAVRAVAVGPDGTIYAGTANADVARGGPAATRDYLLSIRTEPAGR
jgi:hypothetical protein